MNQNPVQTKSCRLHLQTSTTVIEARLIILEKIILQNRSRLISHRICLIWLYNFTDGNGNNTILKIWLKKVLGLNAFAQKNVYRGVPFHLSPSIRISFDFTYIISTSILNRNESNLINCRTVSFCTELSYATNIRVLEFPVLASVYNWWE